MMKFNIDSKKRFFFMCFVLVIVELISINCFAKGWVKEDGEWKYKDETGSYVTNKIVSSGEGKFYLGSDGIIKKNILIEDYEESSYYFGENGSMVVNSWVCIDPRDFKDSVDDDEPDFYWYYFQGNGKAFKSKNKISKKVIDGRKYCFDTEGRLLTGWFSEGGERYNTGHYTAGRFAEAMYYAGDENDGVLRTGWVKYNEDIPEEYEEDKKVEVWLYFDTSSDKKTTGVKTINGKRYSFDSNGVMLSKWQGASTDTIKYYSEENDGHQARGEWIYAVPTKEQNEEDHDDEKKRWFYIDSAGNAIHNHLKGVKGKKYAFDDTGIAQYGFVVIDKNGEFLGTIDSEATSYANIVKEQRFKVKGGSDDAEQKFITGCKVYYFGKEDGNYSQRVGNIQEKLDEDDIVFSGLKNGAYDGYKSSEKKIYEHGFLLKPEKDTKYGIALTNKYYTDWSGKKNTVYDSNTKFVDDITQDEWAHFDDASWNNYYYEAYVVNSAGVVQGKGSENLVKKDENNYSWIIKSGKFWKVIDKEVKFAISSYDDENCEEHNISSKRWLFKSDFYAVDKDGNETSKVVSEYRPFGCIDILGNSVYISRKKISDYDIDIRDHENFLINFYIEEEE